MAGLAVPEPGIGMGLGRTPNTSFYTGADAGYLPPEYDGPANSFPASGMGATGFAASSATTTTPGQPTSAVTSAPDNRSVYQRVKDGLRSMAGNAFGYSGNTADTTSSPDTTASSRPVIPNSTRADYGMPTAPPPVTASSGSRDAALTLGGLLAAGTVGYAVYKNLRGESRIREIKDDNDKVALLGMLRSGEATSMGAAATYKAAEAIIEKDRIKNRNAKAARAIMAKVPVTVAARKREFEPMPDTRISKKRIISIKPGPPFPPAEPGQVECGVDGSYYVASSNLKWMRTNHMIDLSIHHKPIEQRSLVVAFKV
jgi:hypothetical protein